VKKAGEVTAVSVGSPFWMAPEVWRSEPYDGKVDVFSFGVVFYEMMTGTIPYSEIVTNDPSTIEDLKNRICSGQRVPIPSYVFPKIAQVITQCWANDAKDRPTFEDVLPQLEDIVNHLQQQPPPNAYPNYYFDPRIGQYQPIPQPNFIPNPTIAVPQNQQFNMENFTEEYQNFMKNFQESLQI